MTRLSIDTINTTSPYRVSFHEKTRTYRFESDHGIIFAVGFDEDAVMLTDNIYQFSIVNVNNIKSPRDTKVRDTIFAIIEEFFRWDQAALLYICETGDKKQAIRNRLFCTWFEEYPNKNKFVLMTALVMDDEGIENFTALIIGKDNPNFVETISVFTDTVNMFSLKPSNDRKEHI